VELLDLLKSLLVTLNGLDKHILLLVQLGHKDDLLVLDHGTAISKLGTNLKRPLLLEPESFDVNIIILEREIVQHTIVLVDLIQFAAKLVDFVGCVLNELTGVNKLALVGRLLHDGLVHLLVSLIDLLNGLLRPLIDVLKKLFLDLEGLLTKLLLHLACHHSEKWEVDDVIGQVLDLIVSFFVVKDLLTEFLNGGLLLASEELLNEILSVNVEYVLVLLIFLKQIEGPENVLGKHTLNLGH